MNQGSTFYAGNTRYGGSSATTKRNAAARRTFFRTQDVTKSDDPAPQSQICSIPVEVIRKSEKEAPQLTKHAKNILKWIEEYSSSEVQIGAQRRRRVNRRFNPMAFSRPPKSTTEVQPKMTAAGAVKSDDSLPVPRFRPPKFLGLNSTENHEASSQLSVPRPPISQPLTSNAVAASSLALKSTLAPVPSLQRSTNTSIQEEEPQQKSQKPAMAPVCQQSIVQTPPTPVLSSVKNSEPEQKPSTSPIAAIRAVAATVAPSPPTIVQAEPVTVTAPTQFAAPKVSPVKRRSSPVRFKSPIKLNAEVQPRISTTTSLQEIEALPASRFRQPEFRGLKNTENLKVVDQAPITNIANNAATITSTKLIKSSPRFSQPKLLDPNSIKKSEVTQLPSVPHISNKQPFAMTTTAASFTVPKLTPAATQIQSFFKPASNTTSDQTRSPALLSAPPKPVGQLNTPAPVTSITTKPETELKSSVTLTPVTTTTAAVPPTLATTTAASIPPTSQATPVSPAVSISSTAPNSGSCDIEMDVEMDSPSASNTVTMPTLTTTSMPTTITSPTPFSNVAPISSVASPTLKPQAAFTMNQPTTPVATSASLFNGSSMSTTPMQPFMPNFSMPPIMTPSPVIQSPLAQAASPSANPFQPTPTGSARGRKILRPVRRLHR